MSGLLERPSSQEGKYEEGKFWGKAEDLVVLIKSKARLR